MSKDGLLRREESCAEVHDYGGSESPVKMVGCPLTPNEDQKWILTEVSRLVFCFPDLECDCYMLVSLSKMQSGEIIHKTTGKCLDRGTNMEQSDVAVRDCSNTPSQIWKFDFNSDGSDTDLNLSALLQ